MGAEGIVCGEVGLAEMDSVGGGRIVCGEVGLASKGIGMIWENSAGDNIGVEKEVGLNTSGEGLW